MNVEHELILSLLKHKSIKNSLVNFDENELKNPTSKIQYQFIKSHFKKYNECPSIQTMENEFHDSFEIIEGLEKEQVYIDKIMDRNNREKYLIIAKKSAEMAAKGEDLKLIHETILHNIKKIKNSNEEMISINIGRDTEKRLQRYEDKKCEFSSGYKWGFKNLLADSKLDIETPLVGGRLYLVQARPGIGKTFMCCAAAANLAKNNVKSLFISKEMNAEEVLERSDAFASGISYTRLRRGLLSNEEKQKYIEYLKDFEGKEYLEVKQPKECTQDTIAQLIEQEEPQVVFIDYMQLLRDSENAKEPRIQYKNIIYALHDMTLVYNIPIVLISATNREGAKNEEAPDLENIAESDSIGYAIDAVFSLYQTPEEDIMQIMNLRCVKNRHGKKFTTKLIWNIDNSIIQENESKSNG
jgi:replicative DNA helicase